MATEELFVLDDSAFDRLKNYAKALEFFRQSILSEKLIVGKNYAAADFVEARSALENFFAVRFAERRAVEVGRKIERIDIRKTPCLIFAGRLRKLLKFRPANALLIAEPAGKIANVSVR